MLTVVSGCEEVGRNNSAQLEKLAKIVGTPPEGGCYVGVFPGWGELEDAVTAQQLSELEEMVGKQIAFSPFSSFWGRRQVLGTQLEAMAAYGAVPMLRLMPWGEPYWEPEGYQEEYSLQRIIDGEFDEYLSQWADQLKAFAKPVMVTFGAEMNGDWFAWSGVFHGGAEAAGFGDPGKADGPERYVAAYRHIVDLFRQREVGNVTWYFQPNHESHPDEDWNSISAYYPGDEYVDWLGLSVYGAQEETDEWVSFEQAMDPAYVEIMALSEEKPIVLAEWGVAEQPSKGDKAGWYTEALGKLQTRYPRVKIAVVYHERWENGDGTSSNLRIDSSPDALEAYRQGISPEYFVGKVGEGGG